MRLDKEIIDVFNFKKNFWQKCCADIALLSHFWFDIRTQFVLHRISPPRNRKKSKKHWDYKQSAYKCTETGIKEFLYDRKHTYNFDEISF